MPLPYEPLASRNVARVARRNNNDGVINWENYILHKFLANRSHLLAQCRTEHHHLFLVWCGPEYFLYITSHICKKHFTFRRNIISTNNGRPLNSSLVVHIEEKDSFTFTTTTLYSVQIWPSRQLLRPNFEFLIKFNCLPNISSILSHSSRMKCFRCLRFSLRVLTRARMRPGVPTTICGCCDFNVSSSFLMSSPPKQTATCKEDVHFKTFRHLGLFSRLNH